MRITVMGTGYVGLVTGVCLAELGNDVVCYDVDTDKIRAMNGGHCPIYEPGLEDMVVRNRGLGRLKFSADVVDSVHHGDIVFIAVGTPPGPEGRVRTSGRSPPRKVWQDAKTFREDADRQRRLSYETMQTGGDACPTGLVETGRDACPT